MTTFKRPQWTFSSFETRIKSELTENQDFFNQFESLKIYDYEKEVVLAAKNKITLFLDDITSDIASLWTNYFDDDEPKRTLDEAKKDLGLLLFDDKYNTTQNYTQDEGKILIAKEVYDRLYYSGPFSIRKIFDNENDVSEDQYHQEQLIASYCLLGNQKMIDDYCTNTYDPCEMDAQIRESVLDNHEEEIITYIINNL